jgi:hypothetical protein
MLPHDLLFPLGVHDAFKRDIMENGSSSRLGWLQGGMSSH